MREYQIAIPERSNDGKSYAGARAAFESFVLAIANGYTQRPVGLGVWRDSADGRVYSEPMHPYLIACEPDVFDKILAKAFAFFPDQIALYVVESGEARIVERTPIGSKAPQLEAFEIHRAIKIAERAAAFSTKAVNISAKLESALREYRHATNSEEKARAEARVTERARSAEIFLEAHND